MNKVTDADIKTISEKIESLHKKILESKFAEKVAESEMMSLILAVQTLNCQKAEIERLQKIIVGFMDEVGTWSNKYDVDISTIHKLPFLAKEDFNIKNKIKSEAYKEFAEKFKGLLKEYAPYDTLHIYEIQDRIDIVEDILTEGGNEDDTNHS